MAPVVPGVVPTGSVAPVLAAMAPLMIAMAPLPIAVAPLRVAVATVVAAVAPLGVTVVAPVEVAELRALPVVPRRPGQRMREAVDGLRAQMPGSRIVVMHGFRGGPEEDPEAEGRGHPRRMGTLIAGRGRRREHGKGAKGGHEQQGLAHEIASFCSGCPRTMRRACSGGLERRLTVIFMRRS
jgi:hypothetical protein